MLLWSTDLLNVAEEVTIHRPNVSTLLSGAFFRRSVGGVNSAQTPFVWELRLPHVLQRFVGTNFLTEVILFNNLPT